LDNDVGKDFSEAAFALDNRTSSRRDVFALDQAADV
jgi:hypothetical protein